MSEEPEVGQKSSPSIYELQGRVRNAEAALLTARVIGQAQGLLMAQHRCTAEDAFNRLVDVSQHLNVKLHMVAADFVRDFTYSRGPVASILE